MNRRKSRAAVLATAILPVLVLVAGCGRKKAPAPAAGPAPGAAAEAPAEPMKMPAEVTGRVTARLGETSRMASPRGVAVDGAGNVWVVDGGNTRVVVFSAAGKEAFTIGKKGGGEFREPFGAAADGTGGVGILDSATSTVQVFGQDGKLLRKFGGDAAALYAPRGLSGAPDGSWWVADTGGDQLVHFGADGARQGPAIPAAGGPPFSQVCDVAVDRRGTLHAISFPAKGNAAVARVFSSDGKVTAEFAGPEIAATTECPHAVVLADGRIAMTDPQQKRIVLYNADGSETSRVRLEGEGANALQRPIGIAADAQGRLYVSDMTANVVFRIELNAR